MTRTAPTPDLAFAPDISTDPPHRLPRTAGRARRLVDWIWHVRGSVALAPGQSVDEAFDRLDPLLREPGTRYERAGATLTFRKKDQAAQDKMSIFDGGVLRIEPRAAGPVLRYDLASRALLFCFLAPFLFLIFAGSSILIGKYQKPAEAKEKAEPKKPPAKLNPIDRFLGAPAPEQPKDEAKGKGKKKGKAKDDGDDGKKPSPTPAYVFAGLFAALYVVGRVLEDRLIRRLFRRRLFAA